jgi:hypothetical protein
VYEILKWKGEHITVQGIPGFASIARVMDCNNHWLTIQRFSAGARGCNRGGARPESIPLERITVSFDIQNDRLKLVVCPRS